MHVNRNTPRYASVRLINGNALSELRSLSYMTGAANGRTYPGQYDENLTLIDLAK
jgi:hypothetical protein